jgi:L-ascorbate metabolism protein UlaG (beta-lactamase superfamily)
MKIKHYLYNSFIIEDGEFKIAIDPGAKFLYFFRLTTLIPKSEWDNITHIFVTHGDIDHFWHTDRVAEASGAPVFCNETMVRNINGKVLMLGPRDKGVAFTTPVKKLHTISVEKTIQLDGMSITGIQVTHGALTFKFGPLSKTIKPGPGERIGWGAIGFKITFNGTTVVNLGDTLLHEDEWSKIQNPDVLMIPIGGRKVHNTMDEEDALKAVSIMKPRLVIPCHYNCPALFSKNFNPADDKSFKAGVQEMGFECRILKYGDELIV